ncbi:hypothetical protein LDE04_16260 [Lactobacillus delbrueckii subsp. lactis]|nr:hypothetical protein LDE04_16260 [Lactobacillus delbrueckii subsp. lactis]
MDAKNVTITDSEWMVMRAIWTMGHATSRELIDAMNELEGWSASTTGGCAAWRQSTIHV